MQFDPILLQRLTTKLESGVSGARDTTLIIKCMEHEGKYLDGGLTGILRLSRFVSSQGVTKLTIESRLLEGSVGLPERRGVPGVDGET